MKPTLHPLTIVQNEIVAIFRDLGFSVQTGPELETEWYNFDAMNVPADHPARDMQDTFWIKDAPEGQRLVMRTQTSPVQARFMEKMVADNIAPPYAIVVPGKVFRNEATDATHEAQFHQVEGLYVAEHVSVADMKGVLLEFFKRFLGDGVEIRLRPSFFPFVEPGFEVDAILPNGKVMEVLGAGMVHPQVFKNCGVDHIKYSGFAFGMGLDRLAMLRFGITDVRYLYQGDIRLNQW